MSPSRCHYFVIMVEFGCLNEPQSHANSVIYADIGPPMPERTKAVGETNRDTLILQVVA
jgi:hypothetical protein